MKETEITAQENKNFLSFFANFFKQWEKQITRLMTAVLTTLLTWIFLTGIKDLFGYNTMLAILIFSFPGSMFGIMRFGYTFKEVIAGIISGSVSAIAALAVFMVLVTINLPFFEVENIVLISAFGTWWILTTTSRGLYRKYENYFIPFLLFVAIPSVWTIFFYR